MQIWRRLDGQWIGSLSLLLGQSLASRPLGEISVDDIVAGTGLVLPEEPSNQPFDGQS